MGGKFVDFDAAWAEMSAQAPSIKVQGETFALPASPPVAALLRRAATPDDATLTCSLLVSWLEPLVGERVHRWVEHGLERDQLVGLWFKIDELYQKDDDEGEAGAPEAGAPDAPTPTSSPDGDGSKPTSSASTESS